MRSWCPCQSLALLLLCALVSVVFMSKAASALSQSQSQSPTVLAVGCSGGTGMRALQGLLDAGYEPQDIRVLTRNVDKPSMVALRQAGFRTFQANMDNYEQEHNSPSLQEATVGCTACYVHSTSSDTKKLDRGEVDRAKNLVAAIEMANKAGSTTVQNVVYNSAAAEEGHGVYRIAQKHAVEQVFVQACEEGTTVTIASFTSLRANLFMEELWKSYTRPAILNKGKYPFSVPHDRKIYLTSVRDMARLAGTILRASAPPPTAAAAVGTTRIINVAGDVLTPVEMAHAFGNAQDSPCTHDEAKVFGWIARFFIPDLYEVIRFYRQSTETTNVAHLQQEFPTVPLTSFAAFLEETNWGNQDLVYEDLAMIPQGSTSAAAKGALADEPGKK